MNFFDTTEIPGHEKILQSLREIVEEYRKDCWTTGEHMPNPRLREAAIQKILQLSQFYSASDAEKILVRAAGKPFPPGKQKQRPRTS
jgi:hypothetical protein